jgi:hypothetical protein
MIGAITLFTPLSLDDPFILFLFVTAIVLMVGYGVGRWANRQRAGQISDWLEPGLRSLGGTPTVQAISRSAFRFKIANARQPFQTVATSVALISREFLPTWIWEGLNGRRDLLVVHVTFRQPPDLEAEIVDPDNELGRRGEAQIQEYDWPSVDLASGRRVYHAPETSFSRVEAVAGCVETSLFQPWRVALRRNEPHMLISMPMPDLDQANSKQLTRWLQDLSKLIHAAPRSSGGET